MSVVALAWITAHWPAVVAALPSVIVGLTKVTTLPRWASTLLQVASVLTHKDQPGTLKLPLRVEAAPTPLVK